MICSTEDSPDNFYQVGMVVGGVGCNEVDVPGVYADIPFHQDWIDKKFKMLRLNPISFIY